MRTKQSRKKVEKKTDENRQQRQNRDREFRPVRIEPERRGPAAWTWCDDGKVGYVGKLSCLNETRSSTASPSMKFEWTNLLPDKPDVSGFSLSRVFNENDNVGFSKKGNPMCPTELNDALMTSTRYDSKSSVITTEPVVSLKNDHNVMHNKGYFGESPLFKSPALMNSSGAYPGEHDSACKNIAGVQYDYKPQNCFRASIVDSVAEKVKGGYSSNKVLDRYGGLDNKELNVGNESHQMEQDRGCFRDNIVDPIVDKFDVSHSSNKVLDYYHGLDNKELNSGNESRKMEKDRECAGNKSSYATMGSQAMEQDGDCSGSRGSHVECGSEMIFNCGGLPAEKDCGFERDGGLKLSLLNHDDVVYENVARSKEVLMEEEPCHKDFSRNLSERGRLVDLSMIAQNPTHQNDSYENKDKFQQMSVPTVEPLKGTYERGHIVDLSMITRRAEQKISFMKEEHSNEPVKSSNINIKKRLGPPRNIKDRLGPVKSIKKRLGHVSKLTEPSTQVTKKLLIPGQSSSGSLPPWVKQNRLHTSDLDALHGVGYVQGGESFEVKKKSTLKEPLEQSEYFEKLVHNAYMTFVKALNEDQAQKRKFTERGTSTLKCCVCGSFSKEFVNTLSVASHAFDTKKARADHLGFHRALCALMGWNYAANSSGAWIRQILSNSEASALKQDLIIWPPVVFIHNSSIGNTNRNKQMTANIEELMAIIRGMGFGQEITKVCYGSTANQSIVVVNFHRTFSGFQEAENLHKHYAENKHGRAEFQQVSSRSNWCSYKVSSVLYGYLGIAEDLYKLDFEAKNRFFVKSKKEIKAIVDACPF